jgi:trimeric autotransporter adhesin
VEKGIGAKKGTETLRLPEKNRGRTGKKVGKKACKSVEKEQNQEKGLRRSWARSQMGNPSLIDFVGKGCGMGNTILDMQPIIPKNHWAAATAFFLFLSINIAPAFVADDVHWDTQFGAPGTTNNILGIALNGQNIYATGFGSTTPTMKMWDGGQWNTIGTFSNSVGSPTVYDVACVGNTLYAAGSFSSVNGVAATGLAEWNGSAWSSAGLGGTALSLAVNGNNLYVGGFFTNLDSSGVVMTNIGMWDGSAWHALGNGLGLSPASSYVRNILVSGGSIYAGGSFTNSGSLIVSNLAVWNGSTWAPLGGGVGGVVFGLAANGGLLYAGGSFTQAGSVPANYIAAWNGAIWSALSTGLGASPNNIAAFNNQICVTGSFTSAGGMPVNNFAVWNGNSWSAAGSGLNNTGYRLVATSTNLYVGGAFVQAGGVTVDGITSWDGANWNPIGTAGRMNGMGSLVDAVASDGTNWYAGGIFSSAGLIAASNIARFDGTNWHAMGLGIVPSGSTTEVLSIATSNNNVYVGGSFAYAGTVLAENIAQWDGTNWYGLNLGPGGVVASITVRPDGIYAAGAQFNNSSGVYNDPFLSRWDGTNWNGVLAYNQTNTFVDIYLNDPNIGMDSVVFQGTNIFVGGHFMIAWHDPTFTYGTNCSNIMRFDGTYGQIMNTGLNSNVLTMAALGTNLYVGGFFTVADFAPASHIAMWDGANWHAVGGGVVGNGFVSALTTNGNDLYAAGSFTNMGGVSANHIAKWDGTNWTALGSGITGRSSAVDSLAAVGSDLFAGGFFRTSGISDSINIAHWNSELNFDVPQLVNPAWLGQGQFQTRLFGVAGLTNIIQASTNLLSWTPVLTNSAGVYEFTDTNAINYPSRFYRALLGP